MFARQGAVRGRRSRPLTTPQRQLVTRNSKLVHHFAKSFKPQTRDYQMLVDEGHQGLIAAARRYDPKKGYRFSTYARKDIQAHLRRAIAKEKIVRVPEKMIKKVAILPRQVSVEAAESVGTSGGIPQVQARVTLAQLRKHAARLPDKAQRVFLTRYFNDGRPRSEPWTVRQVAKHLKMSTGNVHKLEKDAKRRLGITK